jgi:hypothetical protein
MDDWAGPIQADVATLGTRPRHESGEQETARSRQHLSAHRHKIVDSPSESGAKEMESGSAN